MLCSVVHVAVPVCLGIIVIDILVPLSNSLWVESALPPGAEDEIVLIEHLPGRRVHLQDFFWTGAEDAPPWLDPRQTLSIYETRTVHHTVTIHGPEDSSSPGPARDPRIGPEDPVCVSCIEPTPRVNDDDRDIGVLVGEDPGPRYWLLTVLRSGESVPPKVELRLARLYRAAFSRQQQRHLGLSSTDPRSRRAAAKLRASSENRPSVPEQKNYDGSRKEEREKTREDDAKETKATSVVGGEKVTKNFEPKRMRRVKISKARPILKVIGRILSNSSDTGTPGPRSTESTDVGSGEEGLPRERLNDERVVRKIENARKEERPQSSFFISRAIGPRERYPSSNSTGSKSSSLSPSSNWTGSKSSSLSPSSNSTGSKSSSLSPSSNSTGSKSSSLSPSSNSTGSKSSSLSPSSNWTGSKSSSLSPSSNSTGSKSSSLSPSSNSTGSKSSSLSPSSNSTGSKSSSLSPSSNWTGSKSSSLSPSSNSTGSKSSSLSPSSNSTGSKSSSLSPSSNWTGSKSSSLSPSSNSTGSKSSSLSPSSNSTGSKSSSLSPSSNSTGSKSSSLSPSTTEEFSNGARGDRPRAARAPKASVGTENPGRLAGPPGNESNVADSSRSKLRSSHVGLVQVRMQNTTVTARGGTKLIYSVHLGGKPVPAETAAKDMALLSPQEVALELGVPVVVQSEPYLKETRPLALSRKRDAWLLVGASGAAIILFTLIIVALIIAAKRKRAHSAVSAPPTESILKKDRTYTPTTPGLDNTGYTSETEGRTQTDGTSQRRTPESRSRSPITPPTPQSFNDDDIRELSSDNDETSKRHRTGESWDIEEYPETIKKSRRTGRRRATGTDKVDQPRTPDSMDTVVDHEENLESLEEARVQKLEETASPRSYLSMPSCKLFPKMRSVEPLSKILEPVVARHSELEFETPEMKRRGNGGFDPGSRTDEGLGRTRSALRDPGVVGPIVWDLRRRRAVEESGTSETDGGEGRVASGPVGRARRRLHELLEDSFSLFGTRDAKAKEPASSSSRASSATRTPGTAGTVFSESRGKSAHVSPVATPVTQPRTRPRTSLPRGGTDEELVPETGNAAPHPRGAWGSRPLSAGPFHRPNLPEVDTCRVLADSQLPPEDPAVPLIAAIRKELEKFRPDARS